MLVRSESFKPSPTVKGWERSPVLFILFDTAVFGYLTFSDTDARMQLPSFFCSWASQKILMPSRKSSMGWSMLKTTLPMNTFKRLWSSFRSSMLCIANKLKKEKAASQFATEKFYIEASISIGATDNLSLTAPGNLYNTSNQFTPLWKSLLTLVCKVESNILLRVFKIHHMLVSTDFSSFTSPDSSLCSSYYI